VRHWLFTLTLTVLIGNGLEVFATFPTFGEKFHRRSCSRRRRSLDSGDGSAERCMASQ
jgi:hypothetical protein